MIVIAAATPWEAAPLVRAFGLRRLRGADGRSWADPRGRLLLVETGMGPERARTAMGGVAAPRVDLVVSAGFAGSLSEKVLPGDLVADLSAAPAGMAEGARRAADGLGLRLHDGPIASSPRVLADPREKRALGASSGARAVDMESGALKAWAGARGAAFAAVRTILDGVDDRLPEAPPEGVGPAGLARYAAGRWRDLPLLARLGLRQRRAMAGLCAFLLRLLSEVQDEQTA